MNNEQDRSSEKRRAIEESQAILAEYRDARKKQDFAANRMQDDLDRHDVICQRDRAQSMAVEFLHTLAPFIDELS